MMIRVDYSEQTLKLELFQQIHSDQDVIVKNAFFAGEDQNIDGGG